MECMRIFLDANILVSGIIFKGKEHDLLIKPNKAIFITSEDVLDRDDDQDDQGNGELLAETEPQLTHSEGRPMPRLSLDPAPLGRVEPGR